MTDTGLVKLQSANVRNVLQHRESQILGYSTADVECPSLVDPPNGRVVLTGTNVGSKASYACNAKFTALGEFTRTCLPDGTWSGVAPACDRKYKYYKSNTDQRLCNHNVHDNFVLMPQTAVFITHTHCPSY